MRQLIGNQELVVVEGREVLTLREILPTSPGLHVLFVGKTPAPRSVDVGHYFQGSQGSMFWNRLKEYGLFRQMTDFEDDSLLAHGYGLTDVARIPHSYGDEPSDEEYQVGTCRILEVANKHHPAIIVFIYKKVIDKILEFQFGIKQKASYGFNPWHDQRFGARVFVFPLPGTPCTKEEGRKAMEQLVIAAQFCSH